MGQGKGVAVAGKTTGAAVATVGCGVDMTDAVGWAVKVASATSVAIKLTPAVGKIAGVAAGVAGSPSRSVSWVIANGHGKEPHHDPEGDAQG
jgi:hypothetical protein